MNRSVGLLAGVILMILFTYVLSVFVIHQIQNESSVIGALYSLALSETWPVPFTWNFRGICML